MADLTTPERATLDGELERRLANATGVNPVFPHVAKEQMRAMIEQIVRTDANLVKICSTGQKLEIKAGFVAEEWHAETFNLDSILKDNGAKAYTDKYAEFKQAGFKINDTPDLVVVKDGTTIHQAQSKYCGKAETTYDQFRTVDKIGGNNYEIKYEEMDSLIGPSEQIKEIKEIARKAKLKEQAKGNRPTVENAARMVEENATATLKSGEVESTPLTIQDAKAIAKDTDSEVKTTVENSYKTASTVKKMQEAAAGAAAMSAIVSGTVSVVAYAKLIHEGKIDASEAVIKIASETAAAAADSAIKAAANSGAQSLIIRYGSKELARKMAGQGVGALLRSNAVSVGVVCSVDLIKDLVLFSAGKISAKQLEERSGKNVLTTSAATFGGSLGALSCNGLAAGAFTAAAAPVVASIAGAIICSMAMELAIENGIEAPYRDLVSNTKSLRDSARLLDEISRQIFVGQVNFERFLLADAGLDNDFSRQTTIGTASTEKMRRSIDKI